MIKLTRAFYIPPASTEKLDEITHAAVYLYEDSSGRPCARAFRPKAIKPTWSHYFRNNEERDRKVARFFNDIKDHFDRRQVDAEKRKAFKNVFSTGDILVASWGYEQTNVDFYEITQVKGQLILLCKIGQQTSGDGWTGTCRPLPGHFLGKPFKKRVTSEYLTIDSCRNASKWNTGEENGVKTGPECRWTSYA